LSNVNYDWRRAKVFSGNDPGTRSKERTPPKIELIVISCPLHDHDSIPASHAPLNLPPSSHGKVFHNNVSTFF
jgi:hypothetical protein